MAASTQTRGQEGNHGEGEGRTAATMAPGRGGGDLRDRRGGGGDSSGRRGCGEEEDNGDRGNDQGRNRRQPPPGEENGADAGRSTKAANAASHSKTAVPPLDLSLHPS